MAQACSLFLVATLSAAVLQLVHAAAVLMAKQQLTLYECTGPDSSDSSAADGWAELSPSLSRKATTFSRAGRLLLRLLRLLRLACSDAMVAQRCCGRVLLHDTPE
jgi:hypothetical protein